MNINLKYMLVHRDKNGSIINKPRFKKADSYVQGFIGGLYYAVCYTHCTMPNTGGTAGGIAFITNSMASMGNSGNGLQFGLSDTAVTINNCRLGTPCAHGTNAANKLIYMALVDTTLFSSGGKRYYRMSRTVTNGCGSPVAIKEVGCVAAGAGADATLQFRDLSSLTLADGETATLVYEESITV